MATLTARLDRLEADAFARLVGATVQAQQVTGFRVVIYDPSDPPERAPFRLVPGGGQAGPIEILLPDNGRGRVP